jgi:uncharacterized protein (DUF1697 family)
VIASGNVIFEARATGVAALEKRIETALYKATGVETAAIIRTGDELRRLIDSDPFKGIKASPRIRPHVTFLKNKPKAGEKVAPAGKGYKIVAVRDRAVCYTIDHSGTKTPDVMRMLEVAFGKNITTRTWGTVLKTGAMLGR